jgi:hypothetical protein
MTTGQFINLLAKDLRPGWSFSRTLGFAVAMGTLISAIGFFAGVGFRADLTEAAYSWRFLFKFVLTGTVAVAATGMFSRLGRPSGTIDGWVWAASIALAMLVCAIAVELGTVPAASWITRLVGHNSRVCLTVIPLLSAGPLLCFFLALREGAPTAPGLGGAAAGGAAGGIGATFYAGNCTDDGPLFVATWYSLAILGVSAMGFLAGKLLLRW